MGIFLKKYFLREIAFCNNTHNTRDIDLGKKTVGFVTFSAYLILLIIEPG